MANTNYSSERSQPNSHASNQPGNQGDREQSTHSASTAAQHRRKRARASVWGSLVVVVGILAVGYGAASFYAGIRTENELERYVQQPPSPGAMSLTLEQHERGIWESTGTMVLMSGAQESASPAQHIQSEQQTEHQSAPGHERDHTQSSDAIVIHYRVNHALMPNRLAQVTWSAEPAPEIAQSMDGTFTPVPTLSGIGTLSWQGQFDSSLSMPAFKILTQDNQSELPSQSQGPGNRRVPDQVATDQIQFSAMQGQLSTQARRFRLNMHWPEVDVLDASEMPDNTPVLVARGITLDIDMIDRAAGQGLSQIQISRLQSSDLRISDMTVSGRSFITPVTGQRQATPERDKPRMGLALNTRMGAMASGIYAVQDVVLDGVLEGLDLASVRDLQRIWNQTAGLQQVSQAQASQWRLAMREMVLAGFSAELSHIAARTSFGDIRGHARLDLDAVPASGRGDPAEPIDFEGYVSSKGELTLQGQGISPTLTALGLLTGILVRAPDGVMASYELRDDRLQLNGKNLPALPVLAIINRVLNPLIVQSDRGGILDRLLEDYIEGYEPPENRPEVLPVPTAPDLQRENT